MTKGSKTIIGRTEFIDFPELGLNGIEAKIDTGAYSTALHAHKFWSEEINGIEVLHFELLDPGQEQYNNVLFQTSNFYIKNVRSSNGRLEKRFIFKTWIVIGGRKRRVNVSLTNREKMRYPVLVTARCVGDETGFSIYPILCY